jgi:hypothetical protein
MPSSLSLSRLPYPVIECQSTPNLDVTMDAAALSIHSEVSGIFTSQTRLRRSSSLGAPFLRMWQWLCKAFRIFCFQRDYSSNGIASNRSNLQNTDRSSTRIHLYHCLEFCILLMTAKVVPLVAVFKFCLLLMAAK